MKPIFITGCARSGTSLTAGILHRCGAVVAGEICGATPSNRKGQYENRAIVQNIIKPYLTSIGCDPMGQNPLPATNELVSIPRLRQRVCEQLWKQAFDPCTKTPWFLKGAKLCLIWKVFHEAFPEAKWVITQRDPVAIAKSCMNTPFMRAHKTVDEWLPWVAFHQEKMIEMRNAGLDMVTIDTSAVTSGDYQATKEAVNHLGLTWDEEAVNEFIDPTLWHF